MNDNKLTLQDQIHFHTHGFLIKENVLTETQLDSLHYDCQQRISKLRLPSLSHLASLEGCILEFPNLHDHSEARSHFNSLGRDSIWPIISMVFTEYVSGLLPTDPPICLLNEQMIVKPGGSGEDTAFEMHQDAQYMPTKYRDVPLVSCWMPLDPVHEENGTLFIEGYPNLVEKELEIPRTLADYKRLHNRWEGVYGDQEGVEVSGRSKKVVVKVEEGSVVFLSGWVRHFSFANQSRNLRRVYMPQFSCGRVLDEVGNPVGLSLSL